MGDPTSPPPFPSIAKATTASGPGIQPYGVVANIDTYFDINPVDAYGNPQTLGSQYTGDDFEVILRSGPAPIGAVVNDNNDGTYTVTYTATEAGQYVFDVVLHGVLPIVGSPFTVNVAGMYWR